MAALGSILSVLSGFLAGFAVLMLHGDDAAAEVVCLSVWTFISAIVVGVRL